MPGSELDGGGAISGRAGSELIGKTAIATVTGVYFRREHALNGEIKGKVNWSRCINTQLLPNRLRQPAEHSDFIGTAAVRDDENIRWAGRQIFF